MPLREDSPQIPETPYGTTKLAAEWLIQDYARAYGLGYTLLRYFNASGADPDGRLRRGPPPRGPPDPAGPPGRRRPAARGCMIYGDDYETRDGTCVRDYVHTDDLAQAHQLAVEALEPGDGPGVQPRLGDRGHGPRGAPRLRGGRRAGRSRTSSSAAGPATRPILIASPERIIRELGWSPRYPDIRDIVRTAWEWHRRHPEGFRRSEFEGRITPRHERKS